MRATGCSKEDFPGSNDSETLELFEDQMWEQLTFLLEDFPARMCLWPESARAWMELGRDYGSSNYDLLESLGRDGLLLRTHPVFYPATEGQILPSSFEGWSNSGIASPGGCWTLGTSEWPSDGAVCSLSQVLETEVPRKYFLSPRAAAGILRRAEKRGKKLPPLLRQALQALATRLEEGEKTK